jgi:hypothetical protein
MTLFNDGISIEKILSLGYITAGGGAVGYFLFDLIVLVIITEVLVMLKLKAENKIFLMTISIFFILTLFLILFRIPLGELAGRYGYYILSFMSLINFLPYPFIAVLLSYWYDHDKLKELPKILYILFAALIILLISSEWLIFLHGINQSFEGMTIPPYARLSIVASAILFFLIALHITKQ